MARRTSRRGFTTIELLVAGMVFAIFGTMVVRFVLSQSRFSDQMNAASRARSVSRSAMNILESELRMVQDSGGIELASADGQTIRVLVPYRFGLNCGVRDGKTVVSLLPVDSLALVGASYAGFGWRSHAGAFQLVFPPTPRGADAPVQSGSPSQCTGSNSDEAEIMTISLKGRVGAVLDLSPPQPVAPIGGAVFLFQRVTYSFANSTSFPGQRGLYRAVEGGTEEELMAPFDATARFKYWTRSAAASVSAPPALDSIRGIDVVFAARSSYAPAGRTTPARSTEVASIFFRNVRVH